MWQKNIDVNLSGTFHCVNTALAKMLPVEFGRIVCISSTCAQYGCHGGAAYSTAKAGVHGLVRTAAQETAKFDITVNAVSPGLTDTSMTKNWSPDVKRSLISKIPKGRFAKPKEIALAAVFLSLPENRFITGQVISVNGGSHM